MDVKGCTFPNRVNYEGKQLLKRQRKSLKKLQSPSHYAISFPIIIIIIIIFYHLLSLQGLVLI